MKNIIGRDSRDSAYRRLGVTRMAMQEEINFNITICSCSQSSVSITLKLSSIFRYLEASKTLNSRT